MGNKEEKNIALIIVIVILLIICIGMGGFIFVNKDKLNAKEKTQTEEKKTNEILNEVTNEEKIKLERFIKVASIDDTATNKNATITYFNKGTTELTKEIKLKMAYNDVVNFGTPEEKYVLTDNEIVQMTTTIPKDQLGGKDSNGVPYETVTVIKTTDFEQAYKEFFNETANYTLADIENLGCPAPWGINKDLGKIYLFHRCGGATMSSYTTEIVSYEKDGENYLVHQTGRLSSNDDIIETYKLLWKFGKDLKFISTELE